MQIPTHLSNLKDSSSTLRVSVCWTTGPGCPGRLWSLLLWRYSRPTWTRSCAACCRWPCFSRRVGLDDPQRSLPTPTILWFCDSVLDQALDCVADHTVLWSSSALPILMGGRSQVRCVELPITWDQTSRTTNTRTVSSDISSLHTSRQRRAEQAIPFLLIWPRCTIWSFFRVFPFMLGLGQLQRCSILSRPYYNVHAPMQWSSVMSWHETSTVVSRSQVWLLLEDQKLDSQ